MVQLLRMRNWAAMMALNLMAAGVRGAEWTLPPPPDCSSTGVCQILLGPCELQAVTGGVRPEIEGSVHALPSGAPDLPQLVKLLPIPEGCRVEVVVLDSDFTETNGLDVVSVPRQVLADPDAPIRRVVREQERDEALYSLSTLWPEDVLRVETAQQGSRSWARVVCTPVQYNPALKIVRCYRRINALLVWHNAEETPR